MRRRANLPRQNNLTTHSPHRLWNAAHGNTQERSPAEGVCSIARVGDRVRMACDVQCGNFRLVVLAGERFTMPCEAKAATVRAVLAGGFVAQAGSEFLRQGRTRG